MKKGICLLLFFLLLFSVPVWAADEEKGNTETVYTEEAAKEAGFREVEWVKTGCVITSHGGKGAFGVVGLSEQTK